MRRLVPCDCCGVGSNVDCSQVGHFMMYVCKEEVEMGADGKYLVEQ